MLEKKNAVLRELIYLISRHSQWEARRIERKFRETGVYADAHSWKSFIRLFLSGLGISFLSAGVIFFFAYNWADLHHFLKLGILQALLLVVGSLILFTNFSENIRNLLLTGNTVLVGVLFAVFGQTYQTGANAYDFFLAWTACVSIWVVAAGYLPLWFVFMVLVNTTLVLFIQQRASMLDGLMLLNMLFIPNALAVVIHELLAHKNRTPSLSRWFPNTLALAAIGIVTIAVTGGIVDHGDNGADFVIALFLAVNAFSGGLYYGFKRRDLFYLSTIPFCILLIFCALITRVSEDLLALLFIESIIVITGVTLLVKNLLHLKRKWDGQV